MSSDVYPASPSDLPVDFTAATPRYRVRVAVVLLSLLLFLGVYLSLMGASLWLIWYMLTRASLEGRGATMVTLGVITASGFFFVFLLKGLFKRQRQDRSRMIEISREDQPTLFGFLDRLIRETGAPTPKKVFVTPDVNAAVFYDISVLGLFWPVRKNLLIGLGLVNALNVSELKAVLAHELGHFSQRSMKVGSYVYIANQVIGDMVYSRDSWDSTLSSWASLDLRIAWPAWILIALVWVVRHSLGLLFRLINILDAALSREMEFNADRVAVSAAGSDAIVHALKRLVFADACMNQTFSDLSAAADHQIYTRDLFFHQERSAEHLRRVAQDETLGEPPPVPEDNPGLARIFDADDESKPSMWATHPRDRDREDNAKETYVPAVIDERPAWVLFANPEALREASSEKIVRDVLGSDIQLSPPAEVQKFIDEERAETTFDPRYHGIYEGRPLELGSLDAAFGAPPRDREAIAADFEQLWGPAVADKMARHRELGGELQVLSAVLTGERGGRSFAFRGADVPRGEAAELVEKVLGERTEIIESVSELDARVLQVHAEMSAQLGGDWGPELRQRYEFHRRLQGLLKELGAGGEHLDQAIAVLTSGEQLESDDAVGIEESCEQARFAFKAVHDKAKSVELPPLSNVEDGTTLAGFAFHDTMSNGPIFAGGEIFTHVIQSIISEYEGTTGRMQRLFFKSLGGILNHQEAIAARWKADAPAP